MKCGRYARALPRCWWSGAWRGCDELTTLRRVGAGAASAGSAGAVGGFLVYPGVRGRGYGERGCRV